MTKPILTFAVCAALALCANAAMASGGGGAASGPRGGYWGPGSGTSQTDAQGRKFPPCSSYCQIKYGHNPKSYSICMTHAGYCDHTR